MGLQVSLVIVYVIYKPDVSVLKEREITPLHALSEAKSDAVHIY